MTAINQSQIINSLGCLTVIIPDSSSEAKMLKNVFGITLIYWERSASWGINEQWIAIQATEVSKAFWRTYYPLRGLFAHFGDQYQLFRAVMGSLTIQQNYDDYGTDVEPGTPCITRNERIDCYSPVNNNLQAFNWTGIIIHEMGHVFDNRTHNIASATDLYHDTELTASIGGGLDPKSGNCVRVGAGYQGGGVLKPYVQHYYNDPSGAAYNEDFADMFMNWVVQDEVIYNYQDQKWYRLGFSEDIYGKARYKWIDQNMVRWMQLAMQPH